MCSVGDTKCNFGLRRRNYRPAEISLELALKSLPAFPDAEMKLMKDRLLKGEGGAAFCIFRK